MAEGRIRVVALAILQRPADGAVLAVRFGGNSREPRPFYRPPGGGVEFGERSEAAAVREVMEELGCAVEPLRLLGVAENHFVFDGVRGHEVVFNWLVRFADASRYEIPEFAVVEDNGERSVAHWVQLDDLAARGIPLFPVATADLIRRLPHG